MANILTSLIRVAALAALAAAVAACKEDGRAVSQTARIVRDASFFKANPGERDAKLAGCRVHPRASVSDPECSNARAALIESSEVARK